MKLRYLVVVILLSMFMNSLSAQDYKELGIWLDNWEIIKNKYLDEVGKKSRPREKFLGFKKASLTPSLKKLDRCYNSLEDESLAGTNFIKTFKSFKKAYKKFNKAKDTYVNFIEDDLLKESKTSPQKKAAATLVENLDDLEKSIVDFREEVTKEKKSKMTFKFDLIECDDKTPYLEEPDGTLHITVELSSSALKKYKKTIRVGAKQRLRKLRNKLEKKLIEIDKGVGDKIWEFIFAENLEQETEKARKEAQKQWETVIEEAYVEVEEAILFTWMKIRRSRVRYRKYQVETTKSVAKKTFSLTSGVGRLIGSGGTDVTAYLSTAKAIYDIAMEIKNLLTTPEKIAETLSKDLVKFQQVYQELEKDQSSISLQTQLAKAESAIRENLKKLKDKNAGLVTRALNLEKKMTELKQLRESIDDHESLLRGSKLEAIDIKLSGLVEKHKDLLKRFEKNDQVAELAISVYAQKGAAAILQAKEALAKAYDYYSKAKTAVTKFAEVAETLGVL
ncbi:hypothetical protein [Candidatus Uabimicrobium amorphum]|uniref:Uncharacterized protein n=1 Tax=Uabimicrobium amorphum TaxID=2596890 RepID=A0A5S9IKI9_UABAM|nr:hypothetical protein [Candidatus Uabimicrobium amorphum]BBM82740.1 hypothetical protein UABAM_01083 [Candidatus Uabimicrobium amorphum]